MKAKYGLPTKVIFCKKCVISNQRPITALETKHGKNHKKKTTAFDENGVCDACNWAEYKDKKIDWESRHAELESLLKKHRRSDGSYDVVVPASGGKDSCYVAHILKYEYNMNPLTVTWAPHIFTKIGWNNLQSMINSGVDNVLITPNSKVHRLLSRLGFLNLGHPFQPFIIGQRLVGPKIALEKSIPLVFYGDNVAEYGNRIKDNFIPTMNNDLITAFDIKNEDNMLGGETIKNLKKKYKLNEKDLYIYSSPSKNDILSLGLEVHYMSYYRKWSPQANFYYASKNCNFKVADERTPGSYSKYSGLDDKLEYFHYYMMMIKFGMGRATWDAAQEIRDKKITREEGVFLVNKYDTEFSDKYFDEFLDYVSINKEEFFNTVDKFRSPHIWEKKSNSWILKNPVN
jgi:N-acetyl sugar amidotransferase